LSRPQAPLLVSRTRAHQPTDRVIPAIMIKAMGGSGRRRGASTPVADGDTLDWVLCGAALAMRSARSFHLREAKGIGDRSGSAYSGGSFTIVSQKSSMVLTTLMN